MKDPAEMTPEEIQELIASAPKTPDDRYKVAISTLNKSEDDYTRWCHLGRAAKCALEIGEVGEAESFALELHTLTSSHEEDWNYGNAIQDCNIVLGVIAVNRGDISNAKEHLLAAGRSPGSPQMNSFGPNMTLAKALIESGDKESVLSYFELCRVFWKMHRGRLDEWKNQLLRDELPNFGPNLVY